jgi:hypothetical protein
MASKGVCRGAELRMLAEQGRCVSEPVSGGEWRLGQV